MNMHVTEGNNRFCGPAALSVITGSSVDHCAYIIGSILGKTPDKVRGVTTENFIKAANKLRVKCTRVNGFGNSLFGQIHYLVSIKEQGKFLIALEEHFVVVEIEDKQVFLCDNHTKTAIKAESSARLSQKVIEVYKTEPLAEPVLVRKELDIETVGDGSACIYLKFIEHSKFENEADNYSVNRGSLMLDRKEISQVISKLTEILVGLEKLDA